MVLTVFRSRLREEHRDAYMSLAPRIGEMARQMPGYLSHKVFVAEDGERLTLVEFQDEASQQAWATHADHLTAKKQGRTAFYAEYSLQICQVVRESHFQHTDP